MFQARHLQTCVNHSVTVLTKNKITDSEDAPVREGAIIPAERHLSVAPLRSRCLKHATIKVPRQ